MTVAKANLDKKLALFNDHWAPKTIGQLNDYEIKLVKVLGEFVWHQHEDTDEVFLILDGELTIDLPAGEIVLGPHEIVTIPRGMQHRPRADRETAILLIEPGGVVNTGDASPGRLTARPERI
jgi:mannose-6-phosphate isomerase-like protein (cupin superfamily)